MFGWINAEFEMEMKLQNDMTHFQDDPFKQSFDDIPFAIWNRSCPWLQSGCWLRLNPTFLWRDDNCWKMNVTDHRMNNVRPLLLNKASRGGHYEFVWSTRLKSFDRVIAEALTCPDCSENLLFFLLTDQPAPVATCFWVTIEMETSCICTIPFECWYYSER